jgi:hypothetical protein
LYARPSGKHPPGVHQPQINGYKNARVYPPSTPGVSRRRWPAGVETDLHGALRPTKVLPLARANDARLEVTERFELFYIMSANGPADSPNSTTPRIRLRVLLRRPAPRTRAMTRPCNFLKGRFCARAGIRYVPRQRLRHRAESPDAVLANDPSIGAQYSSAFVMYTAQDAVGLPACALQYEPTQTNTPRFTYAQKFHLRDLIYENI